MKGKRTKTAASKLTPAQASEIEALASLSDEEIDTTSIPEVPDWRGAKRGLFYRPIKRQLTLRLDADIVEWFREQAAGSGGYQTNINRALREYVDKHSEGSPERRRS